MTLSPPPVPYLRRRDEERSKSSANSEALDAADDNSSSDKIDGLGCGEIWPRNAMLQTPNVLVFHRVPPRMFQQERGEVKHKLRACGEAGKRGREGRRQQARAHYPEPTVSGLFHVRGAACAIT